MPMEPRRLALLLAIVLLQAVKAHQSDTGVPTPTLWPERFHALLFMNVSTTGHLQVTDLWYDWPKGRNLNLMQKQLGDLLHDVEWNNGTSYYYTLGPAGTCLVRDFGVGIPRRDWLAGSTYLGRRHTDGFLCHVWEKVDFIWYYEDVDTRRPVRWDFYDGVVVPSLLDFMMLLAEVDLTILLCELPELDEYSFPADYGVEGLVDDDFEVEPQP
ncbi:uncharacterized protein M6B38_200550 [Iris pallida]|uniref:Uncharacterized protein n=1 Tax=Iris pallida TaxID=29817 RepID=A0AAX6EA84_IRIPA|nr:uncharacterized protein M6B38_200550 [Iris pallida]